MTTSGRAALALGLILGAAGFARPSLAPIRSLLGPIAGACLGRRRGGDGLPGAVAGGVAGSLALAVVDRLFLDTGPTGMTLLVDGSFGLLGIAVVRLALTAGMILGIWVDPVGAKPAADRKVSVWLRAIESRRPGRAGGRRPRP